MQLGEDTIAKLTNSSDVVKHLFNPELRRLDNMLLDIIKQNEECLILRDTAGFLYQGNFYKRKGWQAPAFGERHPLHESLFKTMQFYQEQTSKLLMEVHMINQMVFRLVQGCLDRQDVRDALPECIVVQDKHMELNKYPRTRPVAYTLDGDKRAMAQFQKVLPAMEYYAGTHLLY